MLYLFGYAMEKPSISLVRQADDIVDKQIPLPR
jgi:hypothetical protein